MPRKGVRKRLNKRKSQTSPPSTGKPAPRPSVKRKQWTDQQMKAAIKAVEEGCGINQSAGDHGVPASTLKDRVSGKVKHGDKPGPKPYLHAKEEHELSSFLKSCATIGYGKTRKDVMHIAESVAREKGILKKDCITHGWWNRFLERQGGLSLRRSDSTAHVRMNAINEETMNQYFSLLKDVLDEHNLHSKPAQIYNVDESGVPFDYKTPNIVAKTGTKKIRYRQSGKKGQVTVVACASAVGQAIPPMIIFDAQNLNHAWTKDEIPGSRYGLSDNGWINTNLFEGWLVEHFVQCAVPGRPLLLLLDGHSTHYQPDVIRFAREHDIIMLCLPPHTTHESQPLDCGVFKPLKSKWTEVCHRYFQKHPGKVITRFNFNMLFAQAWLKSLIPSNIIAGFKCCGVYPYNPSAISVPSNSDGDSTPSQSNEEDSGHSDERSSDAGENRDEGDKEIGYHYSAEGQVLPVEGECEILSGEGAAQNLPSENDESSTSDGLHSEFTNDQIELFQRRFKEGYNLYVDTCYVNWLKLHHPDELPDDCVASIGGHFENISPLCPVEDKRSGDVRELDNEKEREYEDEYSAAGQILSDRDKHELSSGEQVALELLDKGTGSAEDGLQSGATPTTTHENNPRDAPKSIPKDTPTNTPSDTPRDNPEATLEATPGPGSNVSTSISSAGQILSDRDKHELLSGEQVALELLDKGTGSAEDGLQSGATPTTTHENNPRDAPKSIPKDTPTNTPSDTPRDNPEATLEATPGPGSNVSTSTSSQKTVGTKDLNEANFVSKYLAVPVQSTPSRTQSSLPRAKLLTSLDSLRRLEEKEKKKQEELELKEKRKQEREEKKKQREEELKKKAEKKIMREQERIKKAEQKEEEKKKREEAKRKRSEATGRKKCSDEDKRKRRCTRDQPKESERNPDEELVIDTNVCFTCNGSYEEDIIKGTGADWLACACGRWLHEDCVDDCVRDEDGKDRICPHCLDDLTSKFQ